ncbi:hypothetical protein GCG54_00000168 [Colletotrichum gloeosporioides]|uniref:Uncharacterized protein n=1 Tax=Colletotrichum gloeosporioides TaxID=474922 RepID=A0A8H4FHV0_COLGL|nr:uncharacterized protein GCG54_00000168 [Colletotrichum gloeosporioides]KAF3802802.1 hypothetical protein GCG54_00000168 [Colletotrichum gloeosporioides]
MQTPHCNASSSITPSQMTGKELICMRLCPTAGDLPVRARKSSPVQGIYRSPPIYTQRSHVFETLFLNASYG